MNEWETIRHQYSQKPIQLGLERVAQVWGSIGGKQPPTVIAVGGTNGKGSCCSLLDRILRSANYRIGLYTSPHLLSFHERICIDGIESSNAVLNRIFHRVATSKGGESLTQFELDTLVAVSIMDEAVVDVALLEVGLGGRLDAVNIFEADAAIVTSVDLDHQDYLGDTRELIGFEKAGIYRAQRPAVCADPDPPASLIAHIDKLGADGWLLGKDFHFDIAHDRWTYRGRGWCIPDLPLPVMPGAHQLRNAAGAIAALEALQTRLPLDPEAITRGLREACVVGRFQRIGQHPEIVVDVAHNPEAARALAATLLDQPVAGHTWAVFGILADKDIGEVIAALEQSFDGWFICTPDSPRALASGVLAEKLRLKLPATQVTQCKSPGDALENALKQAGVDDRIVAFGSFYTVAAVLQHARSQQ